tara:strand:- start:51 stop:533 length:483 start_codon:yes stop_codon:yes gene_type:complete
MQLEMLPGRLLALTLCSVAFAADTIKLPVQVDQQGATIPFVTDAGDDVLLEAKRFCAKHMSGMPDQEECAATLAAQVDTVRDLRTAAQDSLPGLSFTVRNDAGEEVRFSHEEGANPAVEAEAFCELHYSAVPLNDCVQAMLQNAQRALEEAAGNGNKDDL